MLSKGERAHANQARVLVLTPTRELAAQVGESVATYGRNLHLSSTVVFGGVKINPQMMKLRKGVDVLVATPGRLLDLYNQKAVKFKQLEVLVLDEADRMLDMGFIHDIKKILALLPKKRQNLMFSATFSDDIRKLAKGMVNNPVEISVSPRNTTVESVEQWLCPVDKKQKSALLTSLIQDNEWQQVLVFCRTKHGANRLARQLDNKGIQAVAIHGNKSQGARTKALSGFKNGRTRILVATDIAARGLDIDQLPHVVNFDLPNVPEDYIHRIGRTGRAGSSGEAVSLVSADEHKQLVDIERLIRQQIERKYIDGFDPVHDLPASRPVGEDRAPRPRRSKKPKPGHSDGQRSGENARGHKPSGKNRKHTGNQKQAGGSSADGANRRRRSRGNRNPGSAGGRSAGAVQRGSSR
jgi:ATP-dependent RNA helicase RhlE